MSCTYVALTPLGISWCKMNSIVSLPECDYHICENRPISLNIDFYHTGVSFLMRSLYPKNFHVLSQWIWCAVGSNAIVTVSESTCI